MTTFHHSETVLTSSTSVLSFINRGIISEQKRLSGTYCHKTGTRPPGCVTLQQPTIYAIVSQLVNITWFSIQIITEISFDERLMSVCHRFLVTSPVLPAGSFLGSQWSVLFEIAQFHFYRSKINEFRKDAPELFEGLDSWARRC